MRYYSTTDPHCQSDFKNAAIKGLADDGGLFFPESIPKLNTSFVSDLRKYSNEEIAFNIMHPYIDNISDSKLFDIISETINFEFPLVDITGHISSLELFHGPTMAFKDVGARFMSRCLGHFMRNENKEITVLVATSGDTGGAVADGFYNVPGVNVVILYPSAKVSGIQEAQLTTLGNNIHALEINGSFDDCQALVKKAFNDAELSEKLFLTSANSINISRWLPQQLYYFFGIKQWSKSPEPPVISVPCGNFGNLCAGLLAWRSGLPVKHFVAACNENAAVFNYFNTGEYIPVETIYTISNAMDVGDPSNFIRMVHLFNSNQDDLKKTVSCYSFSNEENKSSIKELDSYGYLPDPHGAIGYLGLKAYQNDNPNAPGFFLETAHPVKFNNVLENTLNRNIVMPSSTNTLLQKERFKTYMEPDYQNLKEYLLSKFK